MQYMATAAAAAVAHFGLDHLVDVAVVVVIRTEHMKNKQKQQQKNKSNATQHSKITENGRLPLSEDSA